jgi:gliding motility-associated-like protein
MYTASLTVTSLNGCMVITSEVVTVNGLPTVEITASDTMICRGVSPVTLDHTTNAAISFWQSGENSQSIEVFDTGWYYIVATDTNTCINRDSIEIKAYTIPIMVVSPDTFVVIGNSVGIEASEMSTYSWTPTESLDDPTSSSPIATPTVSTVYQVVGLSADGCADTGIVAVEVKDDYEIEYSNIVTPNGDNINDLFVIGNIGSFDNCAFKVLNQWGDEVYSANNYQNDWGGTFNGDPLPEATYYFIMECPVSKNSFTGTINILR